MRQIMERGRAEAVVAIAGAHACTVPATGGDAIDRAALLAEAAALSAVEADA
ncbi:hypothetical protein ACFV0W_32585 [Streptomyces anulatus]